MTKEKKDQKKFKKGLSITFNIVFYLIIAVLLIFSISNIGIKKNGGIPSIFGSGYYTVETDSMDGERKDSFTVNDLLFVRILNDKRRDKLEIGQVVTFNDSQLGDLNTHRIVDIETKTEIVKGEEITNTWIYTQGDKASLIYGPYTPGLAHEIPKLEEQLDNGEITLEEYETKRIQIINIIGTIQSTEKSNVYARVTGTWRGAGKAMKAMRDPVGFGIIIVLPVILLLIAQAFVLFRNVSGMKRQQMETTHELEREQTLQQLEDERGKMREEILKEIDKEKQQRKK